MTLLEVIIAAALTLMIMSTLLFFYRQLGEIGRDLDQAKEDNFKLRYAEARLSTVLPNIVWEKNKNKDFVFFSFIDEGLGKADSQNLIFTFDNKISLDKETANHVIARLFVDPKGRLILAYWPSPKRWVDGTQPKIKQEVLLDGVQGVSFEFFIPPDKKNEANAASQADEVKESKPKKISEKVESNRDAPEEEGKEGNVEPEPKGDWRRQPWLMEFNKLPAMVRMIVKFQEDDQSITFVFPMSQSNVHPIYE